MREAEKRLCCTQNHEYPSLIGIPEFCDAGAKFCWGDKLYNEYKDVMANAQAVSGSGSLRLIAQFLKNCNIPGEVRFPNPTWTNQHTIFRNAGLQTSNYTYINSDAPTLNFKGMMDDINSAPDHSAFVFHACAHNPTGVDPSHEQWDEIADLCVQKKILPFFDTAYQGFASGDLINDAYSVRMFARKGLELLASQSFAKNMGLYGERIGAINIVCKDSEEVPRVLSQVKIIVRTMYSNPPMHGAKIVATILGDKALFEEWVSELKAVVARILRMRQGLYDALLANGCPGNWEHIIKQIGMFTFTGLDPEQSDRMLNVHHIYMLRTGRISVAGLTSGSLQYVADCIKEVVEWKMNGKQ